MQRTRHLQTTDRTTCVSNMHARVVRGALRHAPLRRSLAVAITAALSFGSSLALTQPHPWPFDFDPNAADDPAAIRRKLDRLGRDLPGLPTWSMAKLEPEDADLWLFRDIAELFDRARNAGPFAPHPEPIPSICQRHASMAFRPMLREPASASCQAVEAQIAPTFVDGRPCLRIEFPEQFVRDVRPAHVSEEVVSSLEGLIGLAGEAFTHFDMPQNVVPDWFMPAARRVIAKIRAPSLREAALRKAEAYHGARGLAESNASCFEPSLLATFLEETTGLLAELDTARDGLDALVVEGLAEAARDRQRVLDAGRTRPELPYPSLSDRERELLAVYVGGLYWRMRGRGIVEGPTGTQQKRYYFALKPFDVIGELVGGSDADGAGFWIALPLALKGWGELTDMGRTPGENDKYSDLVDLTARGHYQIDLFEPMLKERGYDTQSFVAGGLQMGPCYYFPWEFATLYVGLELQHPYVIFIDGTGASGEFCAGAAIGLGLAKSFLQGKCLSSPCACLPDCSGRACGDDGCGGVCGSCGSGQVCVGEATCEGDDGGPGQDAGTGGDAGDGGTGSDSDAAGVEDGGAGSESDAGDVEDSGTGSDSDAGGGDNDAGQASADAGAGAGAGSDSSTDAGTSEATDVGAVGDIGSGTDSATSGGDDSELPDGGCHGTGGQSGWIAWLLLPAALGLGRGRARRRRG